VLPSTFVLYTAYRYHWGPKEVGIALGLVGIASAIVQAGLTRRLVPKLGERRALAIGLGFGVAGFAIYGLAPTGWWMLAGIPVMAFWGLAGPAGQSLMTSHLEPHEQGRLQGGLSSLMGVAGLIGPGLFTQTFAAFIGPQRDWHLPGAPMLVAALLLLFAMAVAWRVTRPATAV